MLSAPKFNLAAEKTWALRLGLVFFILLSLVLATRALLPYLPARSPPSRPKSATELRLGQQGFPFPSTEEMVRQHARQKPEPSTLETFYYLAGAIILIVGTVEPIARELRRRRRDAGTTDPWAGLDADE